MSDVMKAIGVVLLLVFVMLGLSWVVMGNDFFIYQWLAPKKAAVERQIFENTPSYIRGNIQELEKQHMDYIKATPAQQAAMKPVILQEAAVINQDQLPPDLKSWISQLKGGF